jgi:hypothetical protein
MLRSPEEGMNCAWSTLFSWPVWRLVAGVPASQSHSTRVMSSDPDSSRLPLLLKLTVFTQPRCSRSLFCMPRDCTKSCGGREADSHCYKQEMNCKLLLEDGDGPPWNWQAGCCESDLGLG